MTAVITYLQITDSTLGAVSTHQAERCFVCVEHTSISDTPPRDSGPSFFLPQGVHSNSSPTDPACTNCSLHPDPISSLCTITIIVVSTCFHNAHFRPANRLLPPLTHYRHLYSPHRLGCRVRFRCRASSELLTYRRKNQASSRKLAP